MKKALVTLAVGEVPEAEWSHLIFKAYCNRHGLDFIVINEWRVKSWKPLFDRRKRSHFEKFQIYELLSTYDRIIYLDSDILISTQCPDLTMMVSENEIGIVADERGTESWKRREELENAEKKLGVVPRINDPYFNCGVQIIPKTCREVFNPANRWPSGRWPEQTGVNYYARKFGIELKYLDETFNYTPVAGPIWQNRESRYKAMIVHYAGMADRGRMQEDAPWFFKQWRLI